LTRQLNATRKKKRIEIKNIYAMKRARHRTRARKTHEMRRARLASSVRSGWPAWEGVFGSSPKMADSIGTRGALSKERRVREKTL